MAQLREKCSVHAQKIKNPGGLCDHNNRVNVPDDLKKWIDESRSHLNYDLIPCADYKKAVDEKIQAAGITRKIRKDAVLSASICSYAPTVDDFELNKKYFKDCVEFFKKTIGENNIIAATVHNDEKTPHLHLVFVPIIKKPNKKGKIVSCLSYKEFYGEPYLLKKLQTDFANEVGKKYGLRRGNPRGKGERNITINEYRANAERVKKLNELKVLNENLENNKKELNKNVKLGMEKLEYSRKFFNNLFAENENFDDFVAERCGAIGWNVNKKELLKLWRAERLASKALADKINTYVFQRDNATKKRDETQKENENLKAENERLSLENQGLRAENKNLLFDLTQANANLSTVELQKMLDVAKERQKIKSRYATKQAAQRVGVAIATEKEQAQKNTLTAVSVQNRPAGVKR